MRMNAAFPPASICAALRNGIGNLVHSVLGIVFLRRLLEIRPLFEVRTEVDRLDLGLIIGIDSLQIPACDPLANVLAKAPIVA